MIIREQQMALLAEAGVRKFEDDVAGHLIRCFPVECEELGEKGVQDIIRYGIERAATHGIALERDVCKYIDLMFVFGRDFDSSPNLRWVPRILEDETLKTPTVKIDRLFDEAKLRMTTDVRSSRP